MSYSSYLDLFWFMFLFKGSLGVEVIYDVFLFNPLAFLFSGIFSFCFEEANDVFLFNPAQETLSPLQL